MEVERNFYIVTTALLTQSSFPPSLPSSFPFFTGCSFGTVEDLFLYAFKYGVITTVRTFSLPPSLLPILQPSLTPPPLPPSLPPSLSPFFPIYNPPIPP